MTVKTCTKVNVGLNVLRRRPDGYHDLETLFVPFYGFGDTLTIEPSAQTSIEIKREGGVDWDPQKDLTMLAWRLLKADFPKLPNVRILLEKHAPVGAGLGGGSADAAFALRVLRDLGDLPLDNRQLAGYAARLGSDCAFFIGCPTAQGAPDAASLQPASEYGIRPMLAGGRGEILEPLDIDLSGYELRVTVPEGVSVSTREAYGSVVPRDRKATQDKEKWLPLREALKLPAEQWKYCIFNDFEEGVFAKYPQIAALKQQYYDSGAIYAAMSGSGSAVFGLFRK